MLKQHLAAFAAAIAIFIPFTANAEAPDLKPGMPVIYLADNLDEKDKLGWCMSRQLVLSSCDSAENKLKQWAVAEKLVEVMLTDELDEARGYCLDISGGKGKRARSERGLQAHTCYHYTGVILEDQGFDASGIEEGQFRIPYFDVCMAVPSVTEGAAIALAQCDDGEKQKFALTDDGQLVTQADTKLCVTVDGVKKREGRGGRPVHVMRPLSLQLCDNAKKAYQTWLLNSL